MFLYFMALGFAMMDPPAMKVKQKASDLSGLLPIPRGGLSFMSYFFMAFILPFEVIPHLILVISPMKLGSSGILQSFW